MNNKIKYFFSFLIVLFLVFIGVIFADTNGIWHRAEDIQGGIFGDDENPINYTFKVPVYFNDELRSFGISFFNDLRSEKITTNYLEVNGNVSVNGEIKALNISVGSSKVATLDSLGKVPLEQLPFHKGDLLAPVNRQQNGAFLDVYYFDITSLEINNSFASKVAAGTAFGLNGNIVGNYTSDANASSLDIVFGKSAYVNGVKIDGTLSLDSICSSAGGSATCGMTSSISPGDFYAIIGANSPIGTNYCTKVTINLDGTVDSSIVKSAGICQYVSECNSLNQMVSNYTDGTSCGSDLICSEGNCISAAGSEDLPYSGTFNWKVPKGITKIKVIGTGGGGSGNYYGANPGGSCSIGGGGGGGGAVDYSIDVVPEEILVIHVGYAGDSTYIKRGSTNLLILYPGDNGASTSGGAGGTTYPAPNGNTLFTGYTGGRGCCYQYVGGASGAYMNSIIGSTYGVGGASGCDYGWPPGTSGYLKIYWP